jgi:hypothetical protein
LTIDITVADRDHKVVDLVLKKRPPPKIAPIVAVEPEPPPPPPPPKWSRPLLIGGIAAGGAGVVSLAVSGAFFGMRQSAISKLQGDCGANGMHCPPGDASTYSSGQTDGTVAAGTFVAGLVALAAGTTLIVLARPKAPKPATGFVVGPTGGSVYGTF